jgi:hypothetical protein
MILCLDPGSKKAGVALFEDNGTLMTAWLSEGKDWRSTADDVMRCLPVSAVRVRSVVIEKMQVYDHTPPAQANACILLSLMAGRVTGLFAGSVPSNGNFEYLPKKWKGQVPKAIHQVRIKTTLSPAERQRVKLPKSKKGHHDIWDAVGIGLYHLRKERRG